MKLFKKHVKNEKGFTLVELLAVVVILGIIAAIAIPAIGTIMKNSEKDAHVVNAKQIANAMRMHVAEKGEGTTLKASIDDLEKGGYIENLSDPSNKTTTYNKTATEVTYTAASGTAAAKYVVTLIGNDEKGAAGTNYIKTASRDTTAGELERADIQLK